MNKCYLQLNVQIVFYLSILIVEKCPHMSSILVSTVIRPDFLTSDLGNKEFTEKPQNTSCFNPSSDFVFILDHPAYTGLLSSCLSPLPSSIPVTVEKLVTSCTWLQ